VTTTVVVVPDIGDFDGIPVIEILVAPGERVAAEQSLVTLESDKATMDVPAPHAGVIAALQVGVGDMVSEGSVLLELVLDEGAATSEETTVPEAVQGTAAATALASAPRIPKSPDPEALRAASPLAPPHAPGGASKSVHASPSIRRFARTLGVDLATVQGTGLQGRVSRGDVERYVKSRLTQPHLARAGPMAGAAIPPIAAVDFSKFGPVQTQSMSRIMRISGPFLQRAWLNIPHVTYHDDADITDLEAFRKSLQASQDTGDVHITPLAFFMKVLAKALRKFPILNASLSPDGEQLILKQYVHIGVAVDTPDGLVVPVVRDVDSKGIVELAEALAIASQRARTGKLRPAEMQGGCMSISSLGGIGGTGFTPIVNAPEVAILGIARSRMMPVWNGTDFEPRLLLPLSLSFDHRVVDGAEGARFINYVCAQLQDVRKLLL
jgi:pyruvate dehydrogenase E2 component (dihydrolipoamide acetyltransferase)